MTTASSVEERLQRLEDIEAIRHLTARYAFHINKGWNGKQVDVDAMPTIFAPDAQWESKDMNLHVTGLEAIMANLPESTQQVDFSMHSFTNPIIDVAGDTATGNWLFWVASKWTGRTTNEVFMSADITYLRTTQGWLIQSYRLHVGTALNA